LIIRAQEGDSSAFYLLIDQNKEKLYRIAYSYLKNEVDSLEAIQEVTYRAYIKLKNLREPKFFDTWLVKILINYCNDELKRLKRTILKELDISQASESTNIVDRQIILEALDRLDPKYQTVIILKYFNDLTIEDTAKLLNRPIGTVKTWLNKALTDLRKTLKKEGEANV